ncbi:hypothetical protein QBC40DRAFT_277145, partial [Triangularia verruculosa]
GRIPFNISKNDVFKFNKVHKVTGYRILRQPRAGLPAAAGLNVDYHPRTVRRAVKDINLRIYIICKHKYISPKAKLRREEFARVILEKYPNKEDWYYIRFFNECHFGWGPQGRVHIIRRPWERYCGDCLLEQDEPEEKDTKRLYYWAAIGHDFKSDLTYYWNCSQSPDFSPIKRCWLTPKHQKRINHWVDQMPQIFKDCIELEGALTGH